MARAAPDSRRRMASAKSCRALRASLRVIIMRSRAIETASEMSITSGWGLNWDAGGRWAKRFLCLEHARSIRNTPRAQLGESGETGAVSLALHIKPVILVICYSTALVSIRFRRRSSWRNEGLETTCHFAAPFIPGLYRDTQIDGEISHCRVSPNPAGAPFRTTVS